MRPGTIVRLPDGRIGTVIYHGLDGYGIRWGRVRSTREDLETLYEAQGGLFGRPVPMPLRPEAMLRKPELEPLLGLECVGENYEVVEDA